MPAGGGVTLATTVAERSFTNARRSRSPGM